MNSSQNNDWQRAKQQLVTITSQLVAEGKITAGEADALLRQVIATDVSLTINQLVEQTISEALITAFSRDYDRR